MIKNIIKVLDYAVCDTCKERVIPKTGMIGFRTWYTTCIPCARKKIIRETDPELN